MVQGGEVRAACIVHHSALQVHSVAARGAYADAVRALVLCLTSARRPYMHTCNVQEFRVDIRFEAHTWLPVVIVYVAVQFLARLAQECIWEV